MKEKDREEKKDENINERIEGRKRKTKIKGKKN